MEELHSDVKRYANDLIWELLEYYYDSVQDVNAFTYLFPADCNMDRLKAAADRVQADYRDIIGEIHISPKTGGWFKKRTVGQEVHMVISAPQGLHELHLYT